MCSVIVCPLVAFSQTISDDINNKEDLIKELSYQYQITEQENGKLNCIGTLNLTLTSTNNIDYIFFERTTGRGGYEPMFSVRRLLSLDTHPIPVQNLMWNIKFRLVITYKDGSHKLSNVYSINDYIDEEDLKRLYESSDVLSIEDTNPEITIDNKKIIHCHTSGTGIINIFEITGNCIYTEKFNGSKLIDFDNLKTSNNPILIIRLQADEKNIFKKICVQ